ncbi:MAG: ABC transporter substrate-binding protein [Methanothrix sp.]
MRRSIILFMMLLVSLALAVSLAGASDSTLQIFGNANMDGNIDEDDIAYMQGIIKGTNEPTKLADANNDSIIDEIDVSQIVKIIEGNETDLTIIDSSGRVLTVKLPINRVVAFNNHQVETMRSIKTDDKIVGVGSDIKNDEILSEFYEYPNVESTKSPNYEEILKLNPQVVFLFATFSITEGDAIQDHLKELNPDIKVIRIDTFKPESYVEETKLLGYLFNKRDEAEEFIEFYESWMNSIKDRVDQIAEDDKPWIYYESRKPYYSAGNGTGHQQKIELAGGRNIFGDQEDYFDVDPESIIKQDPEIIVRLDADIKGYNTSDTKRLREIHDEILNRSELANVRAIKNNAVLVIDNHILGNVRHFIGIGYLAKLFHPEMFKDLDPKSVHQKYLTKFQGLDYNLDEHGVFTYPTLDIDITNKIY